MQRCSKRRCKRILARIITHNCNEETEHEAERMGNAALHVPSVYNSHETLPHIVHVRFCYIWAQGQEDTFPYLSFNLCHLFHIPISYRSLFHEVHKDFADILTRVDHMPPDGLYPVDALDAEKVPKYSGTYVVDRDRVETTNAAGYIQRT
jgi:hypothetical protein